MPQRNCLNCGTPFEAVPDLTRESMNIRLFRARMGSVISLVLALICCVLTWINWPTTLYTLPYEATGPGIVRFYSPQERLLLVENSAGFMKSLHPLCSRQVATWTHMQVNIRFKWVPNDRWASGVGPEHGQECYEILNIQRIGPDKQ